MPDREIQTHRKVKKYLSIVKHQKNATSNYSKWESQDIEIQTFNIADCGTVVAGTHHSWECSGHLWGFIKNDNEVVTVGTERQQFGFFPEPRNTSDHWHGYPVFPFNKTNNKYDICKSLLEHWRKEDILTEDEIAVLVKGKLL